MVFSSSMFSKSNLYLDLFQIKIKLFCSFLCIYFCRLKMNN
jgi:hypothetical protein